jgi:hypothetical protein
VTRIAPGHGAWIYIRSKNRAAKRDLKITAGTVKTSSYSPTSVLTFSCYARYISIKLLPLPSGFIWCDVRKEAFPIISEKAKISTCDFLTIEISDRLFIVEDVGIKNM